MIEFKKSNENTSDTLKLTTATVSVSFGKDVVLRNIAQAGSIIEYWGRRNVTFSITGKIYKQRSLTRAENPLNLINVKSGIRPFIKNQSNVYDEVKNLMDFCNYEGALYIYHPLAKQYGVNTVIITDVQLPFTPTPLVQDYSITAISDYVSYEN